MPVEGGQEDQGEGGQPRQQPQCFGDGGMGACQQKKQQAHGQPALMKHYRVVVFEGKCQVQQNQNCARQKQGAVGGTGLDGRMNPAPDCPGDEAKEDKLLYGIVQASQTGFGQHVRSEAFPPGEPCIPDGFSIKSLCREGTMPEQDEDGGA